MDNYFQTLNSVNVNGKTEQKNGLTYLSWAWAWGEVKKLFPDSTYTIYENANGWNYHTDGRTAWVKTGVVVNGIEHIEMLPVMDFKNRSIPLEQITSFDVNKAIQRSLTKAVARHGLGLYIYAGEDLPEDEKPDTKPSGGGSFMTKGEVVVPHVCADCGSLITSVVLKNGESWKPADVAKYSEERYGRCLCGDCMKKVEGGNET